MDKFDGGFGNGFFSLQLQLNTLFEEVGGEKAIELLDSLGRLSSAEQKLILPLLTRVISRIATGDIRYFSQEDEAQREFEEKLFEDIISDLKAEAMAEKEEKEPKRFKVVEGGKLV